MQETADGVDVVNEGGKSLEDPRHGQDIYGQPQLRVWILIFRFEVGYDDKLSYLLVEAILVERAIAVDIEVLRPVGVIESGVCMVDSVTLPTAPEVPNFIKMHSQRKLV